MDKTVTVGAWVWLVIAMVGCVGAGMGVVVSDHVGKGHVLVSCLEMPEDFPSAM